MFHFQKNTFGEKGSSSWANTSEDKNHQSSQKCSYSLPKEQKITSNIGTSSSSHHASKVKAINRINVREAAFRHTSNDVARTSARVGGFPASVCTARRKCADLPPDVKFSASMPTESGKNYDFETIPGIDRTASGGLFVKEKVFERREKVSRARAIRLAAKFEHKQVHKHERYLDRNQKDDFFESSKGMSAEKKERSRLKAEQLCQEIELIDDGYNFELNKEGIKVIPKAKEFTSAPSLSAVRVDDASRRFNRRMNPFDDDNSNDNVSDKENEHKAALGNKNSENEACFTKSLEQHSMNTSHNIGQKNINVKVACQNPAPSAKASMSNKRTENDDFFDSIKTIPFEKAKLSSSKAEQLMEEFELVIANGEETSELNREGIKVITKSTKVTCAPSLVPSGTTNFTMRSKPQKATMKPRNKKFSFYKQKRLQHVDAIC